MSAETDAELFRALRRTWEELDPAPADLVDRMVAAVATADLSREYALLTLVTATELAAVRGDADALTMQFSDGTASVLVHVVPAADGLRRVDGWVDAPATSVELEQDERTWATAAEHGRFAFEDIPAGMTRLRIVLTDTTDAGTPAELRTPRFEV
ncbi:hypothetical protein LJR045_000368 [Microbacterium sp. LjRoot45]|uniref:hypothetical protein n=1 Tax=Microbacterium sp. LjRoot45 TaxID=3342329 RepID=UPI003ECEE3AC